MLLKRGNINCTDKRTDVWSRNFIIRKINSGLLAVVWSDYEQLLMPVFFTFSGSKSFFNFLPMKNWKNHPKKLLRISPDLFFPRSSPGISPQPKIDFPYYEISGPDICSLICGGYYAHQIGDAPPSTLRSDVLIYRLSLFRYYHVTSLKVWADHIRSTINRNSS